MVQVSFVHHLCPPHNLMMLGGEDSEKKRLGNGEDSEKKNFGAGEDSKRLGNGED